MCEQCKVGTVHQSHKNRRRIWEINSARHCSVIGTCLTLAEIRGLARKLGYKNGSASVTDFYLHGHFVREAGTGSLAAKLLNKLLDRKYASSIKRFKTARSSAQLEEMWEGVYLAGDIPGPYWAILSHPDLDENLALRIYGDVHMLSHLAGASNRADKCNLKRMEQAVVPLEERLKNQSQRHHQILEDKEQTIIKIRRELASLRGQLAASLRPEQTQSQSKADIAKLRTNDRHEINNLKQRLSAVGSENEDLRSAHTKVLATLPALNAEIRALELSVEQENVDASGPKCPFDLTGCNILYVGGRPRQVCRLQKMVACWNGELFHHDGGLERSLDELARAIGKADAVVFPIDCISHNAALKVKRMCRQTKKPFIPLRTSGVASLVAALREGLSNLADEINTR